MQNQKETNPLISLSDTDFINVMRIELGDELTTMTSILAQQEANADFITEQQAIRMGIYDAF